MSSSSSPIELAILSVKPQDSHVQHAASQVYAVVKKKKKKKSRVGNLLLKFHLNGSSGTLTPTNAKGENAVFIFTKNPPRLKFT